MPRQRKICNLKKIYVARSTNALEKIDEVSPCRYEALIVLIVCNVKYGMDVCVVVIHMMLEATNVGIYALKC